jgi:hypothetical protein
MELSDRVSSEPRTDFRVQPWNRIGQFEFRCRGCFYNGAGQPQRFGVAMAMVCSSNALHARSRVSRADGAGAAAAGMEDMKFSYV